MTTETDKTVPVDVQEEPSETTSSEPTTQPPTEAVSTPQTTDKNGATANGEKRERPKIDLKLPNPAKIDNEQCVELLAEKLNEHDEKPLSQLREIVKALGIKKALKMLRRTYEIEANGGIMVYNQERRRTIGGVYFFLAQRWVDKEKRPKIWPEMFPNHLTIDWEERTSLVEDSLTQIGKANIPRIVLIGRPGRVIEKDKVVLTTMQKKKEPRSWPKGLPSIPTGGEGPYIIYITAKQWRKVKNSLKDKKDELIIEGYPTYSPQLKAMTVYAIRTTTKALDRALREKQRADMAKKMANAPA